MAQAHYWWITQGAMAYLRGRCDRGRYASPSLLGVCFWGVLSSRWFVSRPKWPRLPFAAPRTVRLTAVSVPLKRAPGSAIAVASEVEAVSEVPGALTAGAPVPVPALSPQHLRRKGIDADLQTNADGVHRARGLHRVRAENPHTLITG